MKMETEKINNCISPLFPFLNFNESHIVMENISRFKEKRQFLTYLNILNNNTEDAELKKDLQTLFEKVKALTPDQYQTLRKDADQYKIVFPPNYQLPV